MPDVEQRLASIERSQERTNVLLEGLAKKVDERISQTDSRLARHARTLWGENGNPGMLVRLDRLEQSHDRSRWLVRSIVVAVVTLAVGLIFG